jgi:hypothetical protein
VLHQRLLSSHARLQLRRGVFGSNPASPTHSDVSRRQHHGFHPTHNAQPMIMSRASGGRPILLRRSLMPQAPPLLDLVPGDCKEAIELCRGLTLAKWYPRNVWKCRPSGMGCLSPLHAELVMIWPHRLRRGALHLPARPLAPKHAIPANNAVRPDRSRAEARTHTNIMWKRASARLDVARCMFLVKSPCSTSDGAAEHRCVSPPQAVVYLKGINGFADARR